MADRHGDTGSYAWAACEREYRFHLSRRTHFCRYVGAYRRLVLYPVDAIRSAKVTPVDPAPTTPVNRHVRHFDKAKDQLRNAFLMEFQFLARVLTRCGDHRAWRSDLNLSIATRYVEVI